MRFHNFIVSPPTISYFTLLCQQIPNNFESKNRKRTTLGVFESATRAIHHHISVQPALIHLYALLTIKALNSVA